MSKFKEQYWTMLEDAGSRVGLSRDEVVCIVRSNMLPSLNMPGGEKDVRIYQDYMNYGFSLVELKDKWRIPVPTLRTILKQFNTKLVHEIKDVDAELPVRALRLDVKISSLMKLKDSEKEALRLAGFSTLRDVDRFINQNWKLDRVKGLTSKSTKKVLEYLNRANEE